MKEKVRAFHKTYYNLMEETKAKRLELLHFIWKAYG